MELKGNDLSSRVLLGRKDEGMRSHTRWSSWEVWSNWEIFVCPLVAWFWEILVKSLTNFHWKYCWFSSTLCRRLLGQHRAAVSCSCSWVLQCEPLQSLWSSPLGSWQEVLLIHSCSGILRNFAKDISFSTGALNACTTKEFPCPVTLQREILLLICCSSQFVLIPFSPCFPLCSQGPCPIPAVPRAGCFIENNRLLCFYHAF